MAHPNKVIHHTERIFWQKFWERPFLFCAKYRFECPPVARTLRHGRQKDREISLEIFENVVANILEKIFFRNYFWEKYDFRGFFLYAYHSLWSTLTFFGDACRTIRGGNEMGETCAKISVADGFDAICGTWWIFGENSVSKYYSSFKRRWIRIYFTEFPSTEKQYPSRPFRDELGFFVSHYFYAVKPIFSDGKRYELYSLRLHVLGGARNAWNPVFT